MSNNTYNQLIAEIESLKLKVKELEKNKEYAQIITENTSDTIAITTFDLKAEYIYVSNSVKRVLGYEPSELVGHSFFEFVHPEDKKVLFSLLKKYIKQIVKKILKIDDPGLVETIEFRFKNKAGNWIYQKSTVNFIDGKLLAVTKDVTKHKEIEKNLIVAKDFAENLLETASSIIITLNTDAIVTTFNKYAEKLTGYTKEEVIGNNWFDIFIPERDKETIPIVFKNVLVSNPEATQYENPILTKSGKELIINWNSNIIHDEYGNIIGLVSIGINVTKRREAEKKIMLSEEKYRTIIENSSYLHYQTDIEGNIVFVSPSVKAITGYTIEEVQQMHTAEMYLFPKDHEDFISKLKNKGRVSNYETQLRKKDGSIFWESTNAHLIINNKHEFVGIEGISRDITIQKNSEDALKKSEDRLAKTLLAANDGMWDWNLITNKVYFDPRYYEMAGYKVDEFPHELVEFQKRIHPDDSDNVMISAQKHIEGKSPRFNVEFRFKKKNGDWLWVMGRGIIVERDKNNNATRFIGTHTDISDRKSVEDEIRLQNIELQERNAELDAFSHTVAHDLKNPIANISGFAELLIEGYNKLNYSDIEECLNKIIISNDKANQIIHSLLLFASVRKEEVTTEKLIMGDVIAEAIKRFEREIKKTKTKITLPKEWPSVKGYSPWVEEVWANYISNAIKYGGSPPLIKIGFKTVKSKDNGKVMVRFWVSDNGKGIKTENQEIIFEKFERLSQAGTQGHGLGLSIVQRIINKLGGEVGIESISGIGSLFYFTLPICNNNNQIIDTSKVKNETRNLERKISNLKILIAEDEDISDDLLTILLKSVSKKIFHTKSGKGAIDIFRKNPDIDLIMMDIKMPIMSGYEATREIRKFNNDVIIIAQTAYAFPGDREKAIESGCNDYLTKPIESDKLMDILDKWF